MSGNSNKKKVTEQITKTKRKVRRSTKKRERANKEDADSLEAVSTPVNSLPTQKTNPRDDNQDNNLPAVQKEAGDIVTSAAAAISCINEGT